uniref:G-protein coupled receptors family 1 profile domain-containing protein n=1 Tax=Anopheles stephensi TaxID=30069 RepID=A0A182XW95_ANOST
MTLCMEIEYTVSFNAYTRISSVGNRLPEIRRLAKYPGIPNATEYKRFQHLDQVVETCGFLEKDSPSWPAFHIAFFLSSYVVPLILISVLYMWMLSRLWRSSVGGRSAESKKGKKRVTRLVVIVVAAFASLWFPIQVILVLKSVDVFKADTHFKISLQIVSHVLAYTSSCINPLLYAFLSENFRKAFRK